MTYKTVWVVAWEYINGDTPGGGGFDWFPDRDTALRAYQNANREPGWAHFFFPYQTEPDEDPHITTEVIDAELIDCCAKATDRWVSDEVFQYWLKFNYKMGDQHSPAEE